VRYEHMRNLASSHILISSQVYTKCIIGRESEDMKGAERIREI
jgi:hypothetical protein